jgi:hypothetical protein
MSAAIDLTGSAGLTTTMFEVVPTRATGTNALDGSKSRFRYTAGLMLSVEVLANIRV